MAPWARVAGALAVLLPVSFVVDRLNDGLGFPYQGPADPVAAGDEVTIRDPDGECGPLVVSIWRPSILGQWNQTHSGNAVDDAFHPDARTWWQLWGSYSYSSPVPCAADGEMTFTLPDDVGPGAIAVCDGDDRCARIEVAA